MSVHRANTRVHRRPLASAVVGPYRAKCGDSGRSRTMRSRRSGSVTARTVACFVLASTLAQGRERARPATLDAEAAAAMRQKITTPSSAHRRLDVFVGVWAARTSLWMDPSQPPAISEGTLEQKWIFEGRFLQQTYQGEFMGRPFSGLGYIGYDNYLKKYLSTWMDSAGTTIYTR
ncbi:MAG TPA: DUF1579 family protein, partial [Thermoanaerobaculia bacterium]|nr:DUF1579 family protein [Thermoanaerobaculia bacterium]